MGGAVAWELLRTMEPDLSRNPASAPGLSPETGAESLCSHWSTLENGITQPHGIFTRLTGGKRVHRDFWDHSKLSLGFTRHWLPFE